MSFVRISWITAGLLAFLAIPIKAMYTAFSSEDISTLLTLIKKDDPDQPGHAQELYEYYVSLAAQQGHDIRLQTLINTTEFNKNFTTDLLADLLYVFCDRHGVLKSIKVLLTCGNVDLNKKDKDGYTPLMRAILQQSTYSLEAIQMILTTVPTIDLDIKNNEGKSVIDMANKNKLPFDISVRQLLKEYVFIAKTADSVPFFYSYKLKVGLALFAVLGLAAGIYGVYTYLHPKAHTGAHDEVENTPDQVTEHTQELVGLNSNS